MQIHAAIPGPEHKAAYGVLVGMAARSMSLRGAVAFVTGSGVDLLEQLLIDTGVELQVVARGAPITEPDALVRLADLGADVSVVAGANARAFHPKLWLGTTEDGLEILSGSGNLTAGGLQTNAEQFEYLRLGPDEADLLSQQEARFDGFARLAAPLVDVQETSYWREWERQMAARRALANEQRKLDDQLAATRDVGVATEQLYADLVGLFETTRAQVKIAAPGGGERPYVATRFKQSIDRGHAEGLLVPAVARIVRSRTEGYGHLADARRPDLMVETLVLDKKRPYHHLFTETTKAHAQGRMDDYYEQHPE
jgi:HKD family nuclease